MEFRGKGTADIANGLSSKAARSLLPQQLHPAARRKIDALAAAIELDDLRSPPGNRLEALTGDRQGQYSIRINEQYRVCFTWRDGHADDVEIADYH